MKKKNLKSLMMWLDMVGFHIAVIWKDIIFHDGISELSLII